MDSRSFTNNIEIEIIFFLPHNNSKDTSELVAGTTMMILIVVNKNIL